MSEVTKCAPQEAIIDLGKAFTNFFAGRGRYPVFKKKGTRDSFRVSSGFFAIEGKAIRLPHIGWVRMREALRYDDAKVLSATTSRHRDRWFVALACELSVTLPKPRDAKAGGIDLGTGEIATSDGVLHPVPRAYRQAQRQLRRAQQGLARKKKGSANHTKAKAKITRLHGKIADIRASWQHQLTRNLVTEYTLLGIEDLNVRGMTGQAKPKHNDVGTYLPNNTRAQSGRAKSILDVGMHEIRRQLTYKAEDVATTLVVADRWFPSSKTCHGCGAKTKHLPAHIRKWTCPTCRQQHHRDINAAINRKNYAVSSTVSACGEFSASATGGLVSPTASDLYKAGTEHAIAA